MDCLKNLSCKTVCILQFKSMEHLLHHFGIGARFGKKMLIYLIKSTCEQTDQEEYEENEKESPCFLTQCKLPRKFVVSDKANLK